MNKRLGKLDKQYGAIRLSYNVTFTYEGTGKNGVATFLLHFSNIILGDTLGYTWVTDWFPTKLKQSCNKLQQLKPYRSNKAAENQRLY